MSNKKEFTKKNEKKSASKQASSEKLFLVRGKSDGAKAWVYVLVNKMQLPLYHNAMKNGAIDFKQIGKVVYLGLGENPPSNIVNMIRQEYA